MKFNAKLLTNLIKKPHHHFARRCFSQEGEDMVLSRLFGPRKSGFFIDIGAHHPFRYSNTYMFYKKGWRGINIDATPGSMGIFMKYRPKDKNLEIAISKEPDELKFYLFDDHAYNTFDPELAEKAQAAGAQLKETKVIPSLRVEDILEKNVPEGTHIDFMSVDVEGMDLEVLQSNDWVKFRPDLVLVECLGSSLSNIQNDDTYKFITSQDYCLFAKTVNTVFFKNNRPDQY